MVKIDKWNGSCNTFIDFLNRISVPNKTGGTSLHAFNMITGVNLIKNNDKTFYVIVNSKYDGRNCNWNLKWNKDKCRREYKTSIKNLVCKKDYV